MHYKELIVWQKAMDLVDEVYKITKLLPSYERTALSDQMRRSAVSIPSNIAEGQGKGTTRDYLRYLYIARGSDYELETQLLICERQQLLSHDQLSLAYSLCNEVGRLITSIIVKIS